MTFDKVQEYDETPGGNTAVASINIDEGMSPGDVNNAIRAIMSHLRKWNLGPGFISGVVPSNDSAADHDISFGIGSVSDSTGVQMLHNDTALVKQIDAGWAAGTGAGGFPSGLSLTADTWYHLFVIGKTDGTVDAGFDTSTAAANLLTDATGYTLYRRVGSVLVDDTVPPNIIPFVAVETAGGGLDVQWAAAQDDVSNTSDISSSTALTLSVPPDVKVWAHVRGTIHDSGGVVHIALFSPDETTVPDPSIQHQRTMTTNAANQAAAWQGYVRTNTSKQINVIADNAAGTSLDLATIGYRESRR